ncbi:MAG: type II toxin-antitoxin system Phd/YefM family antitoxin [Planctomycetes bacterium]|jgi:prevent-host-death family protein|nr:type II toxin-antitoxin system Phd/YefM family antitoxin [Planctomycetota bacterium]
MPVVRTAKDIKPLSKVRANLRRFVERAYKSTAPVVITRRGEPRAILLGVREYDRLVNAQEREEIRRVINLSRKQIARGESVTLDEFERKMNAKLKKLTRKRA